MQWKRVDDVDLVQSLIEEYEAVSFYEHQPGCEFVWQLNLISKVYMLEEQFALSNITDKDRMHSGPFVGKQ